MSIFNSINEIVREKMNKCVEVGTEQFISSIRAIYGSTERDNPIQIGTCILLQVKQRKYLLTAAHIIDNNQNSSLYVGGGDKLVLIEGEFLCTSKPESERKYDHYDFAYLELSKDLLELIGNVNFISKDKFAIHKVSTKGRLYLALGYPNSKNKMINAVDKSVKPQYSPYASTVQSSPELCQKLGLSGKEHLFINYDPKQSRNADGSIFNAMSPIGMSGGALIDMGCISKPEHYASGILFEGGLAGMLIEIHKEYKVMSAVRINFIIEQIERQNAL